MGLQIGIGICDSICRKFQAETKTSYGYFVHPFFQTLVAFLGEFSCLIGFIIQSTILRSVVNRRDMKNTNITNIIPPEPQRPKLHWIYLSVPASVDIIANTFYLYAYSFTAVSVIQMLSGMSVCMTCLYSYFFLHRKFHRHHMLGIILIVTGVATVAFVNIMDSHDVKGSSETPTKLIGVVMVIIAYTLWPIQYVIEERYLGNYHIHPLQVVGYEGLFGTSYMLLLLPILQFISAGRIREDSRGHDLNLFGKVEDSIVAFAQMGESVPLLLLNIGTLFFIACLNYVCLSVTKYASATARTTILPVTTVGLWIISISLGWENILYFQIIGFSFITFGAFLYNEILILPFWGLNKYVKDLGEKDIDIDNSEDLIVEEQLDYHSSNLDE